ncbi:MAG: hypothetical protein FWE46_05640 [Coriobacteriia bacterium]|nr:hypothetical protein [Coriobacteriia bacterium]MCL2537494.1 hypothetical protein [Coriobacteriia bacterium]
MDYCCLFANQTPAEAEKHMAFELIEEYGRAFYATDGTIKHYLFTRDDGYRELQRCRRCGALFLHQHSEHHSPNGANNYYDDYFQVASHEEALALNEDYGGFGLEKSFTGPSFRRAHSKSETTLTWYRPPLADARLEQLIQKYRSGEMRKGDLKGLSEDQLRIFIKSVVAGNTTVKAAAYSTWKKDI